MGKGQKEYNEIKYKNIAQAQTTHSGIIWAVDTVEVAGGWAASLVRLVDE